MYTCRFGPELTEADVRIPFFGNLTDPPVQSRDLRSNCALMLKRVLGSIQIAEIENSPRRKRRLESNASLSPHFCPTPEAKPTEYRLTTAKQPPSRQQLALARCGETRRLSPH